MSDSRARSATATPRAVPLDAAAERRLAVLGALGFALSTIPRLLLHELWRDEAWQWLVTLESHSLRELFDGLDRGGGQGYLFSLACYAARLVSTSPRGMQLVHLLIATAGVWVFLRWAPLPAWQRVLFVLGYFPFFEFAVLSRGYDAGVLLLWIACVVARSRRSPVWLGLVLGLLAQTTIYALILGAGVAAAWAFDRWQRRRELPPLRPLEVALAFALAAAGLIAGLVQISPAPGTQTLPWRFAWDLEYARRVATLGWRAFVPLPQPQLHFWNTNVMDPWPWLQAALGVACVALGAALLWRSRVALIAYAVGGGGLIAFSYLYFHGMVRHMGHLWILLAAAAWLGDGAGLDAPRSWRRRVFGALLGVQMAAALFASWMDLRHPFSNADAVAALIRERQLEKLPILGHREPPAATVALHLGRPLWSPSREQYVTHPDWGPTYYEMNDATLRCQARKLAVREGSDVVLVLNHEPPAWEEVEVLGATSGAIERGEDYWVYLLRQDRLRASAASAGCPHH